MRAEDEYVWELFWMLVGTRPVGMAAGNIPVDAIFALFDGIGERSVERRLRLLRLIQAMDVAYMSAIQARNEKKVVTNTPVV